MPMKTRVSPKVGLIGLLALLFCFNCEPKRETKLNYEEFGLILPNFTLRDLHKKDVSLYDFRGKIVLLHFWSTWNTQCVKLIPLYNEIYLKYQKLGLEILGVAKDDANESILRFARENNIKYPVVIATGVDGEAVADLYRSPLLPTALLIGKDSMLINIYRDTSLKDVEEITKKIQLFTSI